LTLHAATRAGGLDAAGHEALLRYVLRPELDGADVEPRAARLPEAVPSDGSRRRRFCQRAHAQATACSAIRAKSTGGSVLWKLEAIDGVLHA
jgi:hypothetical protein